MTAYTPYNEQEERDMHLNVTYLIEADDTAPLTHKPDENSAVAWFTPADAVAASTEPWYQERIYPKLIQKTF